MNHAFVIILIPVLLVAAGYVGVFQFMGISPGYPRLILVMALFLGTFYWLSRRNERKPRTNRQ